MINQKNGMRYRYYATPSLIDGECSLGEASTGAHLIAKMIDSLKKTESEELVEYKHLEMLESQDEFQKYVKAKVEDSVSDQSYTLLMKLPKLQPSEAKQYISTFNSVVKKYQN